MTALYAFDLGTTTGVATWTPAGIASCVWRLPKADPGSAYDRLRALLQLCVTDLPVGDARRPTLIAYEAVPAQAHSGGEASHRWGGLEAILLAECVRGRVPYVGIRPAAWKRAAGLRSGTGPAEALAAAQKWWPGVRFETADEAVARWVAVVAAARVSSHAGDPA